MHKFPNVTHVVFLSFTVLYGEHTLYTEVQNLIIFLDNFSDSPFSTRSTHSMRFLVRKMIIASDLFLPTSWRFSPFFPSEILSPPFSGDRQTNLPRTHKVSTHRDITVTDRLLRIDASARGNHHGRLRGCWFGFLRCRRTEKRNLPAATERTRASLPRPDITRCTSEPRLSLEGKTGLALDVAWQGHDSYSPFRMPLCSSPRARVRFFLYAIESGMVAARGAHPPPSLPFLRRI